MALTVNDYYLVWDELGILGVLFYFSESSFIDGLLFNIEEFLRHGRIPQQGFHGGPVQPGGGTVTNIRKVFGTVYTSVTL